MRPVETARRIVHSGALLFGWLNYWKSRAVAAERARDDGVLVWTAGAAAMREICARVGDEWNTHLAAQRAKTHQHRTIPPFVQSRHVQ